MIEKNFNGNTKIGAREKNDAFFGLSIYAMSAPTMKTPALKRNMLKEEKDKFSIKGRENIFTTSFDITVKKKIPREEYKIILSKVDKSIAFSPLT